MAFKYRERTAEDLDKREQGTNDFEGFIQDEFRTYAPPKGDNWIRILPPTWDDARHYGFDVQVHYQVGPERASVICPARQPHPVTGEKSRCPICEASVRAERIGDEELSKELRPSRRVLVWMLNNHEKEKGPVIWAMPQTLDRAIVAVSRDKRTGAMYAIDHPDHGYDISFEKTGEKLNTKYTGVQLARRESAVDEEWLDFITGAPLPFTLRWREYEEIKKLFEGGEAAEASHTPSRREDRDRSVRDDVRGAEDRISGREDAPRTRRAEPDDRQAQRSDDRAERPASRRDEPEPERAPLRRRAAAAEPEPAEKAPADDGQYVSDRQANARRNTDIDDSPLPDEAPAPPPRSTNGTGSVADKAAALRARFGKK